jgi:hypothetical protein
MSGQGSVHGEVIGQAAVELRFQSRPAWIPGAAPVETHRVVNATPESESFEARLSGTIEVVSGKAHLVGAIVNGAGKGQMIETDSRLLNQGPHGSRSDAVGMMTISLPAEAAQSASLR